MKDRFSKQASQYAAFRPTYPAELYDFILANSVEKNWAWDAGTGNGQVARDLCGHFKKILATDISDRQLENAYREPSISYLIGGETVSVADRSFDLITVAQAIHWFDREKFYSEVNRTGKQGGLLAVWGYGLLRISSPLDLLIDRFYKDVVGSFWDKERKLIDEHYRTISFPFKELKVPSFEFSFQWTLEELEGYLETWSSVQKYANVHGKSPVGELINEISPLWGTEIKTVKFPLFMRAGIIP